MVAKLFITPFAADGDRLPIPTERDPDGAVSFELGFGVDYERQLGIDPAAKNIKRETVNELFFDLTDAVGFQQQHGLPEWTPDMAAIGGYAKNVLVWSVNDVWQSQLDGNTAIPSEETDFWFPSKRFMGGGGAGNFGLVGPTTIAVGGAYSYKISPYSSFAQYTATATKGTVSVSGDTLILVISSTETSPVTKLVVTRNDGVEATFDIVIGAQSVAKPSILVPTDGALNVPLGPTLTASKFATYPSGADTQLNADWRIRDTLGAVVWQSLANAVNKTTIAVPDNTLPLNTQLQADVRYRGTTLPVSEWSVPVVFTTTNQSINTPTITSPLNGATGIGATPTFVSTAFATNPPGADTQASSDWRLKNSLGEVIWTSIADTVNKTSIMLPTGVLAVSSQYSIEVRYNGFNLQPSQWSSPSTFYTAATFAFDKYLVAAQNNSPFAIFYGQDVDTFNRLPNPTSIPSGLARSVCFGYDGTYVAFGINVTPFIALYKRSGDTFNKLANPSVVPNSVALGASMTPDTQYLALALSATPFIALYKRSGDTFTKLANPSDLPGGQAFGVAWSPDGNYLAVAHSSAPRLTIYKRSGDTLTKLAVTVTGSGDRGAVAFSPDGTYLAVAALNNGNYLTIHKRNGDVFTELPAPASVPDTAQRACAFSPDNNYLAIGGSAGALQTLNIYKRTGDTFTRLTSVPVVGAVNSLAFSSGDFTKLTVGLLAAPFVSILSRSGDTFTKLADPAALPDSTVYGVAMYPPVLGR